MEQDLIAPRIDSRQAKLAGRAAEQIVADVIELGWPVGHVLGSEAELLERYGVSRAVLREAVRLIEHQHVARMRRGTGGGLVIDEPNVDAVIGPTVIYLLRAGATLDELFDTRIILEELVAELASQRVDEADIRTVRETLANESSGNFTDARLLHTQLATLTGNPVLQLFVETFSRVIEFHFKDDAVLPPNVSKEVQHAHASIARAILTNNPGMARERMSRHLRAEAEFIARQPATVQHLDPTAALAGTDGDKRGEALARQIFAWVLETEAKPGTFIGSEAALMAKYRASRAVLREAIRILEYQQIALTRRGPGGGLFVTEPDSAALTDIISIYLRRHGVTAEHIHELRSGLELAVAERAANAVRDGAVDASIIEKALATESEKGLIAAYAHREDFHSMLGQLSGNRALELVHRVTMRLGWNFFSQYADADPQAIERAARAVDPAHRGIADALLAGDSELAVVRMRAHVSTTSPPAG
ncbi:GntR family transcriptional regulator [Mycolicibacterium moriokaense]|uniref:GntR family transcriptional regulator n=1 Tax=Mycolicibacterium moriokaense TaxID=39691 RepID=A0AAD1HD98_9MYCO|nr:FCD domain-containing protein [Mycolicibacterium moriokaense]MCV7039654.1 FadR family transcriptional regulator [Mycolicibacterium moriokaense]ORB19894.1 GntR family transcriptional regulator [Mycolicibacterium moriokaense]BBX01898.1 GntR family transcriptional regulator [Mycolicibacterium moriokaense]